MALYLSTQSLWMSLSFLPLLALYGIGLFLSIRNRALSPSASKFITIAFVFLILELLLSIPFAAWVRANPDTSPAPEEALLFGLLKLLIPMLLGVLNVVGWILLIFGLNNLFKKPQKRNFGQRLTHRSTRTLPLRVTVRSFRAATAAPVNSIR